MRPCQGPTVFTTGCIQTKIMASPIIVHSARNVFYSIVEISPKSINTSHDVSTRVQLNNWTWLPHTFSRSVAQCRFPSTSQTATTYYFFISVLESLVVRMGCKCEKGDWWWNNVYRACEWGVLCVVEHWPAESWHTDMCSRTLCTVQL